MSNGSTIAGQRADAPFPTKQLTILAICRFSEPIAFNSILAYTYVMVKDLNGGEDRDTAFYAGLLVSAYAVAEALTAIGWGALSDKYGRKPVVLFGLVGVAISCLIFGLAESYWVALLARFIGGALNGNVGVMQTMVAEMVKVPEHEPAAYASQPFVWTLGGIIGSAMGGFLAQPAVFYPSIFPADGIFGRHPYLLPNLVSVVIIVLAVIQGILFLEETNPRGKFFKDEKKLATDGDVAAIEDDNDCTNERTPLTRGQQTKISTISECPDIRETSAYQGAKFEEYTGPTLNFTIVMLTIALVLVSYHQMAFATLLPVHLLDEPAAPRGHLDLIGGLGYTLHDVGYYLSINGFIGLFIQGVIFPIFVDRVGVWRSFFWTIILYPLSYVVSPFLSAFPANLQSSGIYLAMILQSFFGIIVQPTALILLKNATPSNAVLGRVNGLAMAGVVSRELFLRRLLELYMQLPALPLLGSVVQAWPSWEYCSYFGYLGSTCLLSWMLLDFEWGVSSRLNGNNEHGGGEWDSGCLYE